MAARIRLVQVAQSGATNGQVPQYNSGTGDWVPVTLGETSYPRKSGTVLKAAFSGNPKKATVTFATPFVDANYAITLAPGTTGNSGFGPIWESKTASGFVINMNVNNIANLIAVDWTAIKYGET